MAPGAPNTLPSEQTRIPPAAREAGRTCRASLRTGPPDASKGLAGRRGPGAGHSGSGNEGDLATRGCHSPQVLGARSHLQPELRTKTSICFTFMGTDIWYNFF